MISGRHSALGLMLSSRLGILRSCIMAVAGACLLSAFLPGCNASKAANQQQQQQPPQMSQQQPADTPDTRIASDYPDSDVGERLGRLDAMMRTASSDTLPYLKAEYQRILDSIAIARRGPIYTDAPDSAPAPVVTGPVVTGPVDTTRLATMDTAFRSQNPDSLELIRDPSKLYSGLRNTELRRIPGYTPPAPERTPKATTPKRPRARSTHLASDSRRQSARAERRRSTPREVPADSRKAVERKMVNGMAAAQAGRYGEAVEQLEPAVKSGRATASARYSYALSLEKSGKVSQAAGEYLKLSRTGGSLGHKSYVAYCRMLARMGQRSRAKRLVLQFIERHPDSSQVVTARRLLQTL